MKTKNKYLNTLPDKLWQLLKLSLKDIKLAIKDKYCDLRMDCWYVKTTLDKTCAVCMAGAVMRYSLRGDHQLPVDCAFEYQDKEIHSKLLAIEHLRAFEFKNAYMKVNCDLKMPEDKEKKMNNWIYTKVKGFKREDLYYYERICAFESPDRSIKVYNSMARKLKELDL